MSHGRPNAGGSHMSGSGEGINRARPFPYSNCRVIASNPRPGARGGPKWEQGYSLEYPLFFTKKIIYVVFLKYMKKKNEKMNTTAAA